ncbi:MAG: hypothetical protein ACAH80_07600 [Alphaproteobacteria bacterium]
MYSQAVKKFQHGLIKLFLTSILFVFAFPPLGHAEQPMVFSGPNMPVTKVIGSTLRMQMYLGDAIKKGEISITDFEKLDFRFGQAEHGWSPNYKVGSDEDRPSFGLFPADKKSTIKETIATISNDENGRPIINLRRYIDQNGITRDFLYLIIADVKEDACTDYHRYTGQMGREIPAKPIKIAADNHEIVTDEGRLDGCFRDEGDTLFLLSTIMERFKASDETQWHIK